MPESDICENWIMETRKVTTLVIYLASVIEKADEQVLPAVYFFAGASWGATPTELGQITLCRALVQALASPLSGVLGDKYDRMWVITGGCLIWGVMTSAIAATRTVSEAMFCAAVNGFGLSLVIPCCQSVIADSYDPSFRGRAFGMMQFISAMGVVGGGLFATNVGHFSPFGMDGWRFALHVVAAISILTGILVWFYGRDPRTSAKGSPAHKDVESMALLGNHQNDSLLTSVTKILSIPSFGIIILQGVIGSFPWSAMVFYTLWFQLLGYSDFVSSVLRSTFNIGCAVGGVIGGFVADSLALRFPDAGRVMTAQISCLAGFPLLFILFRILPGLQISWSAVCFGLVLFFLGSVMSWCGSCCNAPMFSELVPETLYSKIFAFDRSFEGALASMAAPVVGHLAERYFGFTGTIRGDKEHQSANAIALGNSLFVCITVPLFLCCLSYTGLYWTFPRDRRKGKHDL